MISIAYRKAVLKCFMDSARKEEFVTKVSGVISALVFDRADLGTKVDDIYAFRDEVAKYYDEPKKPEVAE